MASQDQLFIGFNGHLACLRSDSGREVWHSKLKRDSGITTIAVEDEAIYAAFIYRFTKFEYDEFTIKL